MTDFSDANRFAPPRAAVADVEDSRELAGRWMRLLAVVLDGIIGSAVTFALMFVFGHNYFSEVTALQQSATDPAQVMVGTFGVMASSFAPGWLVLLAIQGWSLHRFSGTVGKKLLGIQIVRTDGSRAGFARLFFLRAGLTVVVSMIPLLGGLYALVDILLIFRDSRQCLHDNIADTIVVKAPRAA